MGGYDLSIILPAFNSEKWIKKAIDSVLSQKTDFSFELILIDDGSQDATPSIVDEYRNNGLVKIIHQNNLGFSGARNTGLDIASGRYIMFVDSDDELLPGAIQSLMEVALDNDADIVCGNYIYTYSNGKKKPGSKYKYEKVKPLGKLHGQPWGKVYKRKIFSNLRFPVGYWYEDSIFSMIVWPSCGDCYTIPDIVYGYFRNRNGITIQSGRSKKSIDSLYVIASLLKDKRKFGISINDNDYDAFLNIVKLTYRRTRRLGNKVQQAIFVIQCNLTKEYFQNCNPTKENYKESESLRNQDYQSFLVECLKDYFR